jgi:hypothetical protein
MGNVIAFSLTSFAGDPVANLLLQAAFTIEGIFLKPSRAPRHTFSPWIFGLKFKCQVK